MQTPEEYEVVVLGSGEAGEYIAWTLAGKGMRLVVISFNVRTRLFSDDLSCKRAILLSRNDYVLELHLGHDRHQRPFTHTPSSVGSPAAPAGVIA
ncbi:MAG: hypothetical protein JOY96_09490 [Verrucomicrobia bacterium]|nr:hypothetical protein [Verrucomicrobiota bacterium]MBV9671695.1 hypothetical protein [Verrucomicrobiota bacterium]